MQQKYFLYVLSIILGTLFASSVYAGELKGELCIEYHTDNTSSIPSGFGMPFDVFSSTHNVTMAVMCDTDSAMIEVFATPDQYVYQFGYEWRNNTWNQIQFSGEAAGPWIKGQAEATLGYTGSELDDTNFVVAYICTWDNQWKCGCTDKACAAGNWQIQAFSNKSINPVYGKYRRMIEAAQKIQLDVYITNILPGFAVDRGTQMTLTGVGFTATNNTIHIIDQTDDTKRITISNVPTTNGNLLFTIPNTLAYGKYYVGVSNDNGKTAFGAYLVVKNSGMIPPTITSITPTQGEYGTQVTIRGTGFTPTGNDVVTTFHTFPNVPSSDGTTITFSMEPFTHMADLMTFARDNTRIQGEMEMSINVFNENGGTQVPLSFKYLY